MTFSETLSKLDPELASAIESEQKRQEEHIELIASENYTSSEVMEIQGSVLTNKYAEGYPGRRYYGGCEHVDEAEVLAIERVKELFNADYAKCNLILVHKPIWLYTCLCLIKGTRFLA